MSKSSNLLQCLILTLVVGVFTQCSSPIKSSESEITVSGSVSRPADEAKIEGTIPDYEVNEKSLEYLQSLPMPELAFVFESKIISYTEVPDDVKTILNDHWKEALKFDYETYLNKPADGQTASKKDMAWMSYCNKTKIDLQKELIDAPNGKRKISQTESSAFIVFLNTAAGGIMDKAKKL